MPDTQRPVVAIVDYGMGNLFSVKRACEHAGLRADITNRPHAVAAADAVIVPGVGAFADAMSALQRLDLVRVLHDAAAAEQPLIGICLGMQLLMDESHEFGRHRGLGIIAGDVVRLPESSAGPRRLKVPHIGWNRVQAASSRDWSGSLFGGWQDGEYMYFVHSYYVRPQDASLVWSTTTYGTTAFCSGLRRGHITACQFHPERSGAVGLRFYANLAAQLQRPASVEVP